MPLFQFVIAVIMTVAAAAPSDLSYDRDIIEILRQNIDHNDNSYEHSWVIFFNINVIVWPS